MINQTINAWGSIAISFLPCRHAHESDREQSSAAKRRLTRLQTKFPRSNISAADSAWDSPRRRHLGREPSRQLGEIGGARECRCRAVTRDQPRVGKLAHPIVVYGEPKFLFKAVR